MSFGKSKCNNTLLWSLQMSLKPFLLTWFIQTLKIVLPKKTFLQANGSTLSPLFKMQELYFKVETFK
jgi:hypothetical protein